MSPSRKIQGRRARVRSARRRHDPRPLGRAGRLVRAGWRGLLGVGHLAMWSVVTGLVLAAAVGMLLWGMLRSEGVSAPAWLIERLEVTAAAASAGGRIDIGSVRVQIADGLVPVVRLRDVVALNADGREQAALPDVRLTLRGDELLRGRVQPRRLRISGASLTVIRDEDGGFDLDLTGGAGNDAAIGSIADVLDAIEGGLQRPALQLLDRVALVDTSVIYIDRRNGRNWTLESGLLVLEQSGDSVRLRLNAPVASDSGGTAQLELTLETVKTTDAARLSARFTGVDARDIAAQSPALDWLGVLDAPISGALRVGLDAGGHFTDLNGALEIGRGAFRPSEGVTPVAIDSGKVYFGYRPARQRLEFSAISFDSPMLKIAGTGHAYVDGLDQGGTPSFLGQLRLDQLVLDPEGLLPKPLAFTTGAVDFRLMAEPFRFDLGQLALVGEGIELHANGRMAAHPEGWSAALDARAGRLDLERLLQSWPRALAPRSRKWVEENVAAGIVRNAVASVRQEPGAPPRAGLNFDFENADVRFMRSMPHATGARGHASVADGAFAVFISGGGVDSGAGGLVDIAGTAMQIPEIKAKPAEARIQVRARAPLSAAMHLLDRPPFEIFRKAGRDPDLAEGRAELAIDLNYDIVPKVDPKDVRYSATGTLLAVRSDKLVPDRSMRADSMRVEADNTRVRIAGAGTLDGVPFDAEWVQRMGPEHQGRSQLDGTVELSPRAVRAFRIGLPEGSVSGSGRGRFAIGLRRGQAPTLRLESRLEGVGLSLPALGWSKPRAARAALRVEGALGKPARIDRLSLDAPGLKAAGKVTLKPDGGLAVARFTQVRTGPGLDVAVDLTGRGRGVPPAVTVRGGRLDLRALPPRDPSAPRGGPLKIALDRLTISDSIALTSFAGDFSSGGGASGTFTSQLNGAARIKGTMVPTANGPAFRIRSEDAGAVLAASGTFSTARGGNMELVLQPTGEKGTFDGTLKGGDIRVVNAPALASLLSAISVVGLLEQLGGNGIHFGDVEASFRLTPRSLVVNRGSAVGASMGISLEGVYDLASKRMDLAGVVSPVYLLNGLGQILTRNREGLFGFNYRLTGTAAAPVTSVNPLSILAPGFFRDIFRRKPPRPAE